EEVVEQEHEAALDRREVRIVRPRRIGHREMLDQAGSVQRRRGEMRVVEGSDRDRHAPPHDSTTPGGGAPPGAACGSSAEERGQLCQVGTISRVSTTSSTNSIVPPPLTGWADQRTY